MTFPGSCSRWGPATFAIENREMEVTLRLAPNLKCGLESQLSLFGFSVTSATASPTEPGSPEREGI